MATAFLTSAEYDSDLVKSYYQQFLGRSPDAAGLAGWWRRLEGDDRANRGGRDPLAPRKATRSGRSGSPLRLSGRCMNCPAEGLRGRTSRSTIKCEEEQGSAGLQMANRFGQ